MTNTIAETADWRLGAFMDWEPKYHSEECTYCSGCGEVGGGFKSLDGPMPCPKCFGTGYISVGPTTGKPEIPTALKEHMRRAWWDFLNTPQKEETEVDAAYYRGVINDMRDDIMIAQDAGVPSPLSKNTLAKMAKALAPPK